MISAAFSTNKAGWSQRSINNQVPNYISSNRWRPSECSYSSIKYWNIWKGQINGSSLHKHIKDFHITFTIGSFFWINKWLIRMYAISKINAANFVSWKKNKVGKIHARTHQKAYLKIFHVGKESNHFIWQGAYPLFQLNFQSFGYRSHGPSSSPFAICQNRIQYPWPCISIPNMSGSNLI